MSNRHSIVDMDIGEITLPDKLPMSDGPAETSFTIPHSFPEASLFSLLMSQLGPPNGPMTMAISHMGGDPDAPWKWDYIFQIPTGEIFSVQRAWLQIEVLCWKGSICKEDFVSFIGKNLKKHKESIETYLDKLENYVLLVNPVVRHREMAQFSFQELQQVRVDELFFPDKTHCTKKDQKRHTDSIQRHTTTAKKEMFYSATLVSESAFWAESYLNLMIALFVRPDFKKNEKLFTEYLRTNWQKKIEQLPFYCIAIAHPDLESEELREARWLFELRNKIAHSYPEKDALGISSMWFLQRVPILKNAEPFTSFQLGLQRVLPTRTNALDAYRRAQSFVNYLCSLIEEKARPMFETFSMANPIGWNESKNMYSIPFGEVMAMAFTLDEKSKKGATKRTKRRAQGKRKVGRKR
jgi:hypothetical protein